MDEGLATLLDGAERIRCQQPKDAKKLYSFHEPEVQCISKGKARQRYEFGQKIGLATTNRSNWIVAAHLLPNNPYDGHTLTATLSRVEHITGVALTDAYLDKGYRGHGYTGGATVHVAGLAGDAINAVLAAAGANLRKLLGLFGGQRRRFVFALIRWLEHLNRARPFCWLSYLAAAQTAFSGTTKVLSDSIFRRRIGLLQKMT